LNLPLIDQVLAQLSVGKEMRANGNSSYELFQAGQRVAMLEIFDAPPDGTENIETVDECFVLCMAPRPRLAAPPHCLSVDVKAGGKKP